MSGGMQHQVPAPDRRPGELLAAALGTFLLLVFVPAIGFQFVLEAGLVPAAATRPDEVALRREAGLALFALAGGVIWLSTKVVPLPVAWQPLAALTVLRAYVPLAACWWLLLVLYLRAMQAVGHAVAPQDTLQYFAGADPARPGFWVALLATSCMAPLAEEIVFRGHLQGALRAATGPRTAIVLQGLVFGIVHGIAYALPIALLGMFFGWLRERQGSILAPVLAHAVHNASVALITLAFPGSLTWLYT